MTYLVIAAIANFIAAGIHYVVAYNIWQMTKLPLHEAQKARIVIPTILFLAAAILFTVAGIGFSVAAME